MTERDESGDDDTVESLRRAAPSGDEGDTTVVRPRSVLDDDTVSMDTSSRDDDTVIVAADDETAVAGDRPAADDDTVIVVLPDDETVIVAAQGDDETIQVVRDDDPTAIVAKGDATVGAPRDATVDAPREATHAVDPQRSESLATNRMDSGGSTPVVKPVMAVPARRRRRALRPAPVPPGYGERAVLASGAGKVSTYRARSIPLPPVIARLRAAAAVDRATSGAPSLERQSRRLALLTLGGFVLSLGVSVVGLVFIARSAILGY